MKSEEKKVNELTPMEKLIFTLGQLSEKSKDAKKKKVLTEVMEIIQHVILDDIEENLFIKFYVMTRLFVMDEMTEEDVDRCYLEAIASFKVMFNAKTMFEESNEYKIKNN
jgi:hypothetical protein